MKKKEEVKQDKTGTASLKTYGSMVCAMCYERSPLVIATKGASVSQISFICPYCGLKNELVMHTELEE